MAALIVCLMASSSTVGFGFLPSVVALLRQVMSTNTDLDGLHSASEESVPVKFPLRNLTICGSLFGLPVLLILQSLPSELFGPAFQGGVSCVHIIGAAITHTRYTHGGSIKKKPTLLPRPRVILPPRREDKILSGSWIFRSRIFRSSRSEASQAQLL